MAHSVLASVLFSSVKCGPHRSAHAAHSVLFRVCFDCSDVAHTDQHSQLTRVSRFRVTLKMSTRGSLAGFRFPVGLDKRAPHRSAHSCLAFRVTLR